MVEHSLAKAEVEGSSPSFRSCLRPLVLTSRVHQAPLERGQSSKQPQGSKPINLIRRKGGLPGFSAYNYQRKSGLRLLPTERDGGSVSSIKGASPLSPSPTTAQNGHPRDSEAQVLPLSGPPTHSSRRNQPPAIEKRSQVWVPSPSLSPSQVERDEPAPHTFSNLLSPQLQHRFKED